MRPGAVRTEVRRKTTTRSEANNTGSTGNLAHLTQASAPRSFGPCVLYAVPCVVYVRFVQCQTTPAPPTPQPCPIAHLGEGFASTQALISQTLIPHPTPHTPHPTFHTAAGCGAGASVHPNAKRVPAGADPGACVVSGCRQLQCALCLLGAVLPLFLHKGRP
jgi:hypothetical protein